MGDHTSLASSSSYTVHHPYISSYRILTMICVGGDLYRMNLMPVRCGDPILFFMISATWWSRMILLQSEWSSLPASRDLPATCPAQLPASRNLPATCPFLPSYYEYCPPIFAWDLCNEGMSLRLRLIARVNVLYSIVSVLSHNVTCGDLINL